MHCLTLFLWQCQLRYSACSNFADCGGQGWIRTTEVADSGFTVRPIWPLWNLPMRYKVVELVTGIEPATC